MNEQHRSRGNGPVKQVWHLFSSVRLALILILLISGLSLIGALLIQVPADVAADPPSYASWLQYVSAAKFGVWTPLLSFLHLFDVFHSPWFIGAGTLLILNILICSINRWKNLSAVIKGSPVRLQESFYNGEAHSAEVAVPASIMEDFTMPELGLAVTLVYPTSSTPGASLKTGEVGVEIEQSSASAAPTVARDKVQLGETKSIGGLEFNLLKEQKYSGFQVSRDPGNMLIWIAAGLFMLGITMVLYFPYRQVWVLSQAGKEGTSCLLIRISAARTGPGAGGELNGLVDKIGERAREARS